jgi:hypothetical protein
MVSSEMVNSYKMDSFYLYLIDLDLKSDHSPKPAQKNHSQAYTFKSNPKDINKRKHFITSNTTKRFITAYDNELTRKVDQLHLCY